MFILQVGDRRRLIRPIFRKEGHLVNLKTLLTKTNGQCAIPILADGEMPCGDVYSKGNRAAGCAEANPSRLLDCCKILLFVKVLHTDATENHQNNQRIDEAPKIEVV